MQKRCKDCCKFDELRAQATSTAEREEVAKLKAQHIREIQADRAVNTRGNRLSELDARNPTCDGVGQLIKVQLDGMDQAKWKVPRNLGGWVCVCLRVCVCVCVRACVCVCW